LTDTIARAFHTGSAGGDFDMPDESHSTGPDSALTKEMLNLMYERASCRTFEERDIPDDLLDRVLLAGVHAATGGNLQPWSIIVVRDPGARERLAELNERQWFIRDAPVNLVFCIDWRRLERWAKLSAAPFTADRAFRHFWISFQDTIIAAQCICTAADAVGLGSVYIGTVLECFRELRDMLALPKGVFPVVILALGWPKKTPAVRPKLGLSTVVHREQYAELSNEDLVVAYDEKYRSPKIEITPERLEQLERVCRRTGGQALADECLARVREAGYINMAQRYFGLHYEADFMPVGNDDYVRILEESGFDWFRRWEPIEE
jgi:FMN reductase [NAD(P)H]